jgi:glyoxylase I family protein
MLSSRSVVARAATDESEALALSTGEEGPVGNCGHLGCCPARVSLPSVRSLEREEAKQAMSIDHVLAVVPVADFEAAHAWYERLFGRPADNLPMEGRLVEWRVTGSGWVQVTRDADRAGSALLNFAVDDLDQHVADVSGRGLAPGAIETVNKGVQLSAILDPDGNMITFIGNFRVRY